MLRDFSAPDLIRIFRDIPGAIWPIAVDYFRHAGITLTITDPVSSGTVSSLYTIQAQVGTETDPSGSMSNMLVNIRV
ncbi:MAG: hypothetical protein P8Y02_10600 [Deinococcales bacterium]